MDVSFSLGGAGTAMYGNCTEEMMMVRWKVGAAHVERNFDSTVVASRHQKKKR